MQLALGIPRSKLARVQRTNAVELSEQEALKAAVEHLHGYPANYQSDESVTVLVEGEPPLQRDIATFALGDVANVPIPAPAVAYAWSEAGLKNGGTLVHYRVILGDSRVTSPREALRVALLLPPDF